MNVKLSSYFHDHHDHHYHHYNDDNCELVTHFYSSSPSFYFRFENKFDNQRVNDDNDNDSDDGLVIGSVSGW